MRICPAIMSSDRRSRRLARARSRAMISAGVDTPLLDRQPGQARSPGADANCALAGLDRLDDAGRCQLTTPAADRPRRAVRGDGDHGIAAARVGAQLALGAGSSAVRRAPQVLLTWPGRSSSAGRGRDQMVASTKRRAPLASSAHVRWRIRSGH